jgi:hypothetical protein
LFSQFLVLQGHLVLHNSGLLLNLDDLFPVIPDYWGFTLLCICIYPSSCPEIEIRCVDWAQMSRLLPEDGDRIRSPKRRVLNLTDVPTSVLETFIESSCKATHSGPTRIIVSISLGRLLLSTLQTEGTSATYLRYTERTIAGDIQKPITAARQLSSDYKLESGPFWSRVNVCNKWITCRPSYLVCPCKEGRLAYPSRRLHGGLLSVCQQPPSVYCLRVLSSCAVDKETIEILPAHVCLIHWGWNIHQQQLTRRRHGAASFSLRYRMSGKAVSGYWLSWRARSASGEGGGGEDKRIWLQTFVVVYSFIGQCY